MEKKVACREFILDFRSDGQRETVIWGPGDAVKKLAQKEDITLEDLMPDVCVSKREAGSYEEDYAEVFGEIEMEHIFFQTFRKYLNQYYIPLSRGEKIKGSCDDDPFEFLERMEESHNIIYSYMGYKIDYYIRNGFEIPVSIFHDFFYSDRMKVIWSCERKKDGVFKGHVTYGEWTEDTADRAVKNLTELVDQITCRIDELVAAIRELPEENRWE